MERSRRAYFLLLAMAGVFGWSVGLWAAPIVAFVVIEAVWTAAEWAREHTDATRSLRTPRDYVR